MDAKRGFVPEDEKNFSEEAIRTLRKASGHIRYLINEGYDKKQAAVFVGNHFLLSERQRLAVMRSVASDRQIHERRKSQVPVSALKGKEVWIDGFNTIITLEVMLSGSPVFTCMDGTIRDLAALRGTYRLIPETEEAAHMLFQMLEKAGIRRANILLDEPVSNSGRLKCLLAEAGERYTFALDIRIVREVDRFLYDRENVITSDSVILDHCRSWVNLTALCMKERGMNGIRVWGSDAESVRIRLLLPNEAGLLKDFTYEAIFIPEGIEMPARDIVERPELKMYYEDFGSGPADYCLAAADADRVIGAVWTRIMNDYGHVDENTPSFAISLLPEFRGKGIGTRLMEEMLLLLEGCGYKQASLAVQKANYAVRMYEKAGFKTINENEEEYIMICDLQKESTGKRRQKKDEDTCL